jgi:anti-anti-sigma factor
MSSGKIKGPCPRDSLVPKLYVAKVITLKTYQEETMEIQTSEFKRCAVLKTSGRIDGSNAPQLAQAFKAILAKGVHNIVFDMSEVNFMASAGWWVLIDTQKACKPSGELVLAQIDAGIKDALNLVGMGTYFNSFEDVTSAVGYF